MGIRSANFRNLMNISKWRPFFGEFESLQFCFLRVMQIFVIFYSNLFKEYTYIYGKTWISKVFAYLLLNEHNFESIV